MRVMDNEAWASNVRRRFEEQVLRLIREDEVDDLTVIAYSAGCTVVFDGLREGGPVEQVLGEHPSLPIQIVTAGSALNRVFIFALDARTPAARRFLHQRVTAELTREERPYVWTDIYARFDLVPGGPMREEVKFATRVHEGERLHSRQVINFDSPLNDHFGYFDNKDVVVPRLISAIYGGYRHDGPAAQESIERLVEPPPGEAERAPPPRAPVQVTKQATRRRAQRIGWLRLVSTLSIALAVGFLAWYWASAEAKDRFSDLAFWVGDRLGAIGEWEIVGWLGDQTGLTKTAMDHPDLIGLAIAAAVVLVAGHGLARLMVNYALGRFRSFTEVL
jgi:hypothetical protein